MIKLRIAECNQVQVHEIHSDEIGVEINQSKCGMGILTKQCSGVLCDRRVILTLKRKVYKNEIRPAKILCGVPRKD